MNVDFDLVAKLVIPVLTTILAAVLKYALEQRARLIAYLSHVSAFTAHGLRWATPTPSTDLEAVAAPLTTEGAAAVEESREGAAVAGAVVAPPSLTTDGTPPRLFAHSVLIRNVGKKTAFNVRLGHAALPITYEITPSVQHKAEAISNNGGWEIQIPTIVPGEAIQIAYLYAPPITWNRVNSYFKSDEGRVETVNVSPTRRTSTPVRVVYASLIYLGVFALAYFVVVAVQWISEISQAAVQQ